jgi:alkylation response protein AidB-like acyl-CoA dehydrogenase
MCGFRFSVHTGGGVSDDFGLAHAYAMARTLRFADGPDEVHRDQIARLELREQPAAVGNSDNAVGRRMAVR